MNRTLLQRLGDWLFFLVWAPAWLAIVNAQLVQEAVDAAEGEAQP